MSIGPSVLVGDWQDSIRVRKILRSSPQDFICVRFSGGCLFVQDVCGIVPDALQRVPDFGIF